MDKGAWPRRMVRLGYKDIIPAMIAMAKYENIPDGQKKLDAMMEFIQITISSLPEPDKQFYTPLFRMVLEDTAKRPMKFIWGTGLRHKASEEEMLARGLSSMFKELSNKLVQK
jgi:hypothetical protein